MANVSRRDFVRQGCFGLTGAAGLVLAGGAEATEPSGELGAYGQYQKEKPAATNGGRRPANWVATEDNILGPFHRPGAPFRGKVTPPLEPGTVLLVSGRVFGLDTKRPLANVVIDVWQANAQGRYDNDDPRRPPAANLFLNRARLVTDDNGYYEFETVKPGAYRIGPKTWRPSHIHFWLRHPRYRELVTQLYFRGDEHQKTDNWIRASLIIELRDNRTANKAAYKSGAFDIILAPARSE